MEKKKETSVHVRDRLVKKRRTEIVMSGKMIDGGDDGFDGGCEWMVE